MDSKENIIRATKLFQQPYYINATYESKCVVERWTRKIRKTKSLQFLIETSMKLGSFIDAYAFTCEFF